MSKQLTQFDEQLVLKMTLGQQFKQPFEIAEPLQGYGITQTETAQDILQLNQYWMLLQQASKMPEIASEKILSKLQQTTVTVDEKTISETLIEVLQWIFKQDRPMVYQQWLDTILKSAQSQGKVIPRQLITKVVGQYTNPSVIAEVLPQFAFQSNYLAKLRVPKYIKSYLNTGDSKDLLHYLISLSKSDWNKLMSVLMGYFPEFIQNNLQQIWLAAVKDSDTRSYVADTILSQFSLMDCESIYRYFKQLPLINAEELKQYKVLSLYLYFDDNSFYPELLQLIQSVIRYDAKEEQLVLTIDEEKDFQLEKFGFFNNNADLANSRRELKSALQSNLAEAHSKYAQGPLAGLYLKTILVHVRLSDWQYILGGDWENLFTLKNAQSDVIYEAFLRRCLIERRDDFAELFYQKQMKWIESKIHTLVNFGFNDTALIFKLMTNASAQQLLTERIKHYANVKDNQKFWYIMQQHPAITSDETLACLGYQVAVQNYAQLKTDDEYRQKTLKSHVEWLILKAYPLQNYDELQGLFPHAEWIQLGKIISERYQITLN